MRALVHSAGGGGPRGGSATTDHLTIAGVVPGRPTVVEVWAPWCTACGAMRSDFEAVAAEHDVDVVLVDASQTPDIAEALGVRATPTIIGYSAAGEVVRLTGRRTRAELASVFAAAAAGGDSDTAQQVRTRDATLRIGTGVALVVAGLATGPSWPLVAIGAAIGAIAAVAASRS